MVRVVMVYDLRSRQHGRWLVHACRKDNCRSGGMREGTRIAVAEELWMIEGIQEECASEGGRRVKRNIDTDTRERRVPGPATWLCASVRPSVLCRRSHNVSLI